jgi:hypothetical protein
LLIFTNWKKKNAPVKGEWYPVCILRIQKYGVPRGVFPIALHVYPTPTPDDICLTVTKKTNKKKKTPPQNFRVRLRLEEWRRRSA